MSVSWPLSSGLQLHSDNTDIILSSPFRSSLSGELRRVDLGVSNFRHVMRFLIGDLSIMVLRLSSREHSRRDTSWCSAVLPRAFWCLPSPMGWLISATVGFWGCSFTSMMPKSLFFCRHWKYVFIFAPGWIVRQQEDEYAKLGRVTNSLCFLSSNFQQRSVWQGTLVLQTREYCLQVFFRQRLEAVRPPAYPSRSLKLPELDIKKTNKIDFETFFFNKLLHIWGNESVFSAICLHSDCCLTRSQDDVTQQHPLLVHDTKSLSSLTAQFV